MPEVAHLTIYAFGVSSFLIGAHNLLNPQTALAALDLPAAALPASQGNSLAALAMGMYYCLAARRRDRSFFALTVPMRLLTASVFWKYGANWTKAALWEGGGAILTALALILEGF